jgi:hypothetical protein
MHEDNIFFVLDFFLFRIKPGILMLYLYLYSIKIQTNIKQD